MIQFRNTGFQSKSLGADISLGAMDGLDSALWCYGFATVIFAGALSPLMPVGVLALLLGWALLSTFVSLTSKAPIHIAGVDEQSVVILAAIGLLMSSSLGDAASSS